MKKPANFTESTGNVFEDLGLPDSEELRAKADLAFQIGLILDERELTQAEAAAVLGVDQPKVSALRRGRLTGFSMERLYRFLNALGNDVEITVRPTPKSRNRSSVRVVSSSSASSSFAGRSQPKRSTAALTKTVSRAKTTGKHVGSSKQRT